MSKETQCLSEDECFKVQMGGTKFCASCPLFNTDACGGKNILITGKNAKGYTVNEKGLVCTDNNAQHNAQQPTKKQKRKKKKK